MRPQPDVAVSVDGRWATSGNENAPGVRGIVGMGSWRESSSYFSYENAVRRAACAPICAPTRIVLEERPARLPCSVRARPDSVLRVWRRNVEENIELGTQRRCKRSIEDAVLVERIHSIDADSDATPAAARQTRLLTFDIRPEPPKPAQPLRKRQGR